MGPSADGVALAEQPFILLVVKPFDVLGLVEERLDHVAREKSKKILKKCPEKIGARGSYAFGALADPMRQIEQGVAEDCFF